MARWYATFDNSTDATLEAAPNRYQRKPMTNGAALKSTLQAAQSALSSAFYAAIEPGNQDGTLGIVVPQDGYTRSGGQFSGSNLHLNAAAVHPPSRSTRPTAPILVAGSTPASPVDGFSVSETLYTDAVAALESAMTAAGVRDRLGLDPYRTLASLWHDNLLSYLAWDDFTPGQPTVTAFANTPRQTTEATVVQIDWTTQYPQDAAGDIVLYAAIEGGVDLQELNVTVPATPGTYIWNIPANTFTAGTKSLSVSARFRDPNAVSHLGVAGTYFDAAGLVVT